MTIADLLSFASWPSIALGASLLFALSRLPKSSRWHNDAVLWIGILCIGAPMFFVVFIYHDGSQALVFDANVFVIMIGVAFLAIAWTANRGSKPTAAILAGVVGASLTAFGCWYLVGDFLLPRVPVAGVVASTNTSRGKAGFYYHVVLDGRYHTITGDLFETVRPGDRVEALAGKASGTIFSVNATR